jgi:hypothetical protein
VLNVLLGAGFAEGLDLPGTKEITEHVSRLEGNYVYFESSGLPVKLGPVLWKIANSYYDAPNFETLLHLVESMISAKGSRLGFNVADTQKIAFNAFMDTTPRLVPVVEQAQSLADFGAFMMTAIADLLDERIKQSKMEKQKRIEAFFQPFSKCDLRISTLNYDDSIERGAGRFANLWDGFADENPGAIDYAGFQQTHYTELLHLHGSIRFAPATNAPPTMPPSLVRFKSNIEAKEHRRVPPGFNALTQAGELIFTGPMLSGLRKTEKLVVEPYGLYHQRFSMGLLESPRFLCVGYGGNDTYVNSAIVRARAVHGDRLRAAYITKVDANAFSSNSRPALYLPALHSIQYANEYEAFWQRLVDNGLILEENGMLLIGTRFPLKEHELERLKTFLQS